MKQIIALKVHKFTREQIVLERQSLRKYPRYASEKFESLFPAHCISNNDATEAIVHPEYHFQFMDSIKGMTADEKKEVFFMFDVDFMDTFLQEEASMGGETELLETIFKPLQGNIKKMFEKVAKINTPENRHYPENTHFVVDVHFRGSDDDVEADMALEGFLNDHMILIKFKDIL